MVVSKFAPATYGNIHTFTVHRVEIRREKKEKKIDLKPRGFLATELHREGSLFAILC